MALDMYLKIEGITGESKDSNHDGWSHLKNFSWGSQQSGSMSAGGGGGAGKVTIEDLKVTAAIDKIAPILFNRCAAGTHIPKIEVSVCKAGGEQIEYSRTTLEDVIVTSVDFVGAQDSDELLVEYTFQSVKYKNQYWEQGEDGSKGAETSCEGNNKLNDHSC